MSEKTKTKRPKQQRLPEVNDARLEDLHKAAERYVDLRDERMEALKGEIEAGEEVMALMLKHRKDKYVCDGLEIYIAAEKKVKVRLKKEKEE